MFRVLSETLAQVNVEKKTAKEIMISGVDFVSSHQAIKEVRKMMIKNNYSQLPVIANSIIKGALLTQYSYRRS